MRLDRFHVRRKRKDFRPVIIREEENRAFILQRLDGLADLDGFLRDGHIGQQRIVPLFFRFLQLPSGVADLHAIRRCEVLCALALFISNSRSRDGRDAILLQEMRVRCQRVC